MMLVWSLVLWNWLVSFVVILLVVSLTTVMFVSSHWPNRPLALRGHVANASLKQWVVILLLPKIDRTHKNYLTPEIWEETHSREIFYGTLIFQQSSMICIGRHVGGHALAPQHGGQNYFLFISCWMSDSYVQMCYKRYHVIFLTFSLRFKCKICVRMR